MKKLFLFLLIAALAFYFVPLSPGSRLSQIKESVIGSIASIGISKADYEKELQAKTAELASYEKAVVKFEEDVDRMEANMPTCPITGKKSTFTTRPRVPQDVLDKIDKLKAEIAVLKTKV
jgi:hypothetical protein